MGWVVVDKISDGLILSIFRSEKVKTDTFVFRLHYKLSVWLMAIYSCIYTTLSLSKSITCMTDSKGVDITAVNDYCWSHGTYTINNLDPMRKLLAFPGIDKDELGKGKVYHQYYKWMFINILALLLLPMLPRKIWYSIENGTMKQLVQKLHMLLPFGKKEDVDKQKNMLIDYLFIHLGYNRRYSYGFVLCEALNVFVAATSLLMWDCIAGHEFSQHGAPSWNILESSSHYRSDRLSIIFPHIGKCVFKRHGPSGNIQPLELICTLPLNIVNERAAIFFWYYFIVLIPIGICGVLFRIALIFSTRFRMILLSGLAPLTSRKDAMLLSKHCSYSDWFVIYQMGKTVQPEMFRQVLNGFIKKIRNRDSLLV